MTSKPLRSRITTAALLVTPAVAGLATPGVAQAVEQPACESAVLSPKTYDGEIYKITDTVTVSCEGVATEGNYRIVSEQQAFVESEDGKTPASKVDVDEMVVRTDDAGKFTTTFVQEMNTPAGPVSQGAKVAVTWTLLPQVGNAEVASGHDESDEFVSED